MFGSMSLQHKTAISVNVVAGDKRSVACPLFLPSTYQGLNAAIFGQLQLV